MAPRLVWARCNLAVAALLVACVPESEPLAELGGSCEFASDCREPLSCIDATCVDDQGPVLRIVFPDELEVIDLGGSVFAYVSVLERKETDSVELIFDPYGPNPTTTLLEWAPNDYPFDAGLTIVAPMQSGPHWLRARVLDGEGRPYENPSATTELVVFVRDGVHADKPSLVLLEPRPDHVHPVGMPLTFEAAVQPGTFVFSSFGEPCEPLPDCDDPFAPECEDECGPISRGGSLFTYLDVDLPGCAQVVPGCAFDYVTRYDEQLDALVVRGTIDAMYFDQAGDHTLAVMLTYPDGYAIYPSEAAPIYASQPLRVE